ncbi:4Fe-4S binding protein [Sciscionella sediminilitoris]|uniref:4Fe-4S binding protein n=1 Tax=Sciscionella sediminilitoris TaxID=1445613 RepID=UPI0004DF32CB|nr:4Fe-4S binding protein [Sciscionella sp. SE31]
MAYAITQTCCNDASCVAVCPVNCIHPTPDEPDFGTTEMLYIDPETCIDCGACADACPVDAVRPADLLSGPEQVYSELNRAHFGGGSPGTVWGAPRFPRSLPSAASAPRVAVVGTGPAAGYTVQSLLRSTDAEITVLDRAPLAGGLVRFGVAPDHPATKQIGDTFAGAFRHPRVRVRLGVEIGGNLSHAELAAHHHAVIYAVGAEASRDLGIPGESLPGSLPATTVVRWYNGSPEVPVDAVDLAGERAVIVGNGNVALDIARILLSDPDGLADTPIAGHALAALRASKVREVVLLGRRGPEHAAYTRPEFLAMRELRGVTVHVDVRGEPTAADPDSKAALLHGLPSGPVDLGFPPPEGKRLVLRFGSTPGAVLGEHGVRAVRVDGEDVPAGLFVRSIGCRGVAVPGVPFDAASGVIPNERGRVPAPGTYVVGWAKRGAHGGIGANRACAAETVDTLFDDIAAGRLAEPAHGPKEFERLLRAR